ncbi:MAG TPA: hypothetical protein PKD83_06170 [Ignavibacteria bacterium]|nr:hypothetical protein [Ignavibacteria bacterium]
MNRDRSLSFLKKYNSFTKSEKTEFLKFANSGLFSRKRDYTEILTLLISDSESVSNNKKIKSQTKWNRCSELAKIADKFLLLKSLDRNKLNESVLLLDELRNRNLNSSFNLKFKDLIIEYHDKPITDFDFNLFFFISNKNIDHLKTASALKKYDANLNVINNRRTKLYLLELLMEMTELWRLRHFGKIIPETYAEILYKNLDMKQILYSLNSESDKKKSIENNLIEFTYLLLLCMNGINENENYNKVKKIFFNNLNSVSKEYRFRFYYLLINYSFKRLNSGEKNGMQEFFYLVKQKLKEGLTKDFNNDYYFFNITRDIVIAALSLKKFSWVKNFMENYSKFIPEPIREDNINLFNARLNFETQKYSESIDFLNKIKTRKPVFYIDVMTIRLKALFELKEYEKCFIELKKLREFHRKNRKIPNEFIRNSIAFCKAFNWLMKLNENPNKKILDNLEFKLIQLISNEKPLSIKWLKMKTEYYISNKNKVGLESPAS